MVDNLINFISKCLEPQNIITFVGIVVAAVVAIVIPLYLYNLQRKHKLSDEKKKQEEEIRKEQARIFNIEYSAFQQKLDYFISKSKELNDMLVMPNPPLLPDLGISGYKPHDRLLKSLLDFKSNYETKRQAVKDSWEDIFRFLDTSKNISPAQKVAFRSVLGNYHTHELLKIAISKSLINQLN